MSASREDLRGTLDQDRAHGTLKRLEDYLERFPGDAVSVARAYLDVTGQEAASATDAVDRLGHYRIERELGRGGQGIVYLARDTRLNRVVALKVLTRAGPGSEHLIQRFRREAEVTSRLAHPGICGILDAAIDRAVPYIAMRFIEGKSLAQHVSEARSTSQSAHSGNSIITFDEAPEMAAPSDLGAATNPVPTPKAPAEKDILRVVKIFELSALALHAAHEAGVIHRDIKPGNILVAKDGQPVILDFGMAHDEESDQPSLTQSGDLFGTPAYMSPEQLLAQRVALDRRTDIWSLGVTLYESLTLQRPFDAPTRQALYQQIMIKEPPSPRSQNPAIPRDLAVVLMTALEKDRDKRYQTALDFAEDLRRVRELEPIRARPAGPIKRLLRFSQRNPALALLILALIVLLPALSAFIAQGKGARDRERLASEKEAAERTLRTKIESESAALRQKEKDTAFVFASEEIGVTLGLLHFAIGGEAAVDRTIQGYLDLFKDYGLPLDGTVPNADLVLSIQRIESRDQAIGRKIKDGLYDLGWMLAPKGIGSQDPKLKEKFAVVSERVDQLLDKAEIDPWYSALRAASATFHRSNDPEVYEAIQKQPPKDDAHKMAVLAIATINSGRIEPGLTMLDRALELQPNDFVGHYARGGITLGQLRDLADKETIERARHHIEVAVALRPQSAVTWSMLSHVRALSQNIPGALEAAERSTTMAPDSPVAWFMKGALFGYGRKKAEAISCFQKTLEIDPTFSAARQAIADVEAGRIPRMGNRSER